MFFSILPKIISSISDKYPKQKANSKPFWHFGPFYMRLGSNMTRGLLLTRKALPNDALLRRSLFENPL